VGFGSSDRLEGAYGTAVSTTMLLTTAMVVLAFVFGAILGTGPPPAPTYILVAIVIAPPMIRVGVNPWVVHFFAFFLGVWGELTPPTSLVAAVTAKIANASFYSTLNRALQICVSLFTLMAGVLVHPELVIEPGINQLGAALLVLVATIGITFSLQAVFADRPATDVSIRSARLQRAGKDARTMPAERALGETADCRLRKIVRGGH
jgi:TRAP-type uncharacterized transport system fused permease subunit